MYTVLLPLFLAALPSLSNLTSPSRQTITLDGTWQVAEGTYDRFPYAFNHSVEVPGFLDTAQPPFDFVGRGTRSQQAAVHNDGARPACQPCDRDAPLREAFWYRRTFRLRGGKPDKLLLKVGKAAFGTQVYLNRKLIGEHVPCFTPGYFDLGPTLLPDKENELIIRVGAWRDAVAGRALDGYDKEKTLYLPGIFDSVELIQTGTPFVRTLQIVPQVTNRSVRVVSITEFTDGASPSPIVFSVLEDRTGRTLARHTVEGSQYTPSRSVRLDITLPISQCRLWTPEDPVLYRLEVITEGDYRVERFGMREFRVNAATGRAELNGTPYFLRGSSLCFQRFTENPLRGGRPWDEKWVRKLMRQMKDMHRNALRFCAGFPPELWYRICDEEGILIQDEAPIRYGEDWPQNITPAILRSELSEWLRERWNHACMVVWDAHNESHEFGTRDVVRELRVQDLSNRLWDNGSLWLDRKGEPAALTGTTWQSLAPEATPAERSYLYARILAAKAEFWRSQRKEYGVMEFRSLTGGMSDQFMGDQWLDVHKLEWEPNFRRYVGDAFSPVGVMVDLWGPQKARQADTLQVPIACINDLPEPWSGEIRVVVADKEREVLATEWGPLRIDPGGRATAQRDINLTAAPGEYTLFAEIKGPAIGRVRSVRDLRVEARTQ